MTSVKKQILNSCLDTSQSCLNRIDQIKALNAFITVFRDDILNQALESDKRIANGNIYVVIFIFEILININKVFKIS